MAKRKPVRTTVRVLGVECGATHSVAVLADIAGRELNRIELGGANLRLLSDAKLRAHFRALSTLKADAVAIGMAGARTEADRTRIRNAAGAVWRRVPVRATNDLETALATGGGGRVGTRVLVLSGTGSCCFGRAKDGRTAKIGGWGHLLGDKGSAYEIGLRAAKAVVYYLDRDGRWPALGRRILRALQLNEPEDLIGWAQSASKGEIAALAREVFQAWEKKDPIASDILTGAASSLVKDALACVRRLGHGSGPVEFVLSGGVLCRQPKFAARVRRELKRRVENAIVTVQKRESVWGAVRLARACLEETAGRRANDSETAAADAVEAGSAEASLEGLADSPTERRNPRSMNLDTMPLARAVRLMLEEESNVPAALMEVSSDLEWVVGQVARSLKRGGRLFYVGAGTSGRLGVLDASECPPTFRADPEQVQGIIAGGKTALWRSVEGAEDDPQAGARAVAFRGIRRGDVVIGIAASGRTPFVLGALQAARKLGAVTVLLSFNPRMTLPRGRRPHRVIAVDVGPEVLTGSTRLKAGTATKLALNLFTTLAMVRLGKVRGNLMIDVQASNSKLRDRAVRMVRELAEVNEATAREALRRSEWRVGEACGRLARKKGTSADRFDRPRRPISRRARR